MPDSRIFQGECKRAAGGILCVLHAIPSRRSILSAWICENQSVYCTVEGISFPLSEKTETIMASPATKLGYYYSLLEQIAKEHDGNIPFPRPVRIRSTLASIYDVQGRTARETIEVESIRNYGLVTTSGFEIPIDILPSYLDYKRILDAIGEKDK